MNRRFLMASLLTLLAFQATLPTFAQTPAPPANWWSLRPLSRPTPPRVADPAWANNPIDAFVRAKLQERGWKPAPPADRITLIRRVSYDLIGLPPTPQEIAAFVQDKSPNAYEKVVSRLLADPRYGERWARHWLDVARFGESQGFERDKIRDHAWRYRDYVIQAFNADKPYARFIQEQIAGDVLEPITAEGIIATGFLVGGPWDEVGATQISQVMRQRAREEELEDILAVVGQTFLGLTVNCARCHTHKFDPIPQRDYYRLKAALEGVVPGDRPALSPQQQRDLNAEKARLRAQIDAYQQQKMPLLAAGRQRVSERQGKPQALGSLAPLAQWTFESDAKDMRGTLHGTLRGGAKVANGRLQLDGSGAFLESAPLPRAVREKTLEAWVILPNRTQRGGGVLALQTPNGATFDSLVFAEREAGKWIAGSNFLLRTQDVAGSIENAAPNEAIHLAVVYHADNQIALYRNGAPYGRAYTPSGSEATLRVYPANGAQVLIGLRHTGAGNGFLAGEIEEARLYDRALTPNEIAASYRAGTDAISPIALRAALTAEEGARYDALQRRQAQAQQELEKLSAPTLVYAAKPRQPEPTYLLARGDVESPGELLSAGGLSCVRSPSSEFSLPPNAPEAERRRRLAAWIADPQNPLPARVLVNRIWHYHFGRGIVGTPNDFGVLGEQPSHRELLDWLASEFLRTGGRIKALHRLILLSQTYRQSAQFNPQAASRDADNKYLWRFAPRRLEGEAARDAMLAVSGLLNPKRGGPSFRPFTVSEFNSHFYTLIDSPDPELQRRTIYRMNVQSARHPLLDALDCPDPSAKTPRRAMTTTPLQALEMMNNAFVLRQARGFAERLQREAGAKNAAAQVELAYRLAFGRAPTAAEKKQAVAFVRQNRLENLCWVLFNATEFLYVK